jgi:60 kDa SS-A/Ro ribonucleoprotein
MALTGRQRLDDVNRLMREYSRYMGGTDAALPMLYAAEAGREIDVFEVYTDNETWAGSIHPSQALRAYRQKSGINAKLISVGLTATEYSIADPNDAGMMDVVGFDTAAPSLMASFAQGKL